MNDPSTIRKLTIIAAALSLLACAGTPSAPPAETAAMETEYVLAVPDGFRRAPHGSKSFDGCGEPSEPHTGALDFPSKFEGSDEARDDLNREAERRYRSQTQAITELERRIAKLADRGLETGDPAAVACAVDWLHRWAEADALMGKVETHTGKSVRKWALASVSAAWLRFQRSEARPLAPHRAEQQRIESWFLDLAERVVDDWSEVPDRKFNNHEYWAAWAVMASAVTVNDRELYDWSVAQYRRALRQIDDQGFLANELSRDTRALYYHNYSLPPLAMMAAFGAANGEPLVEAESRALERLARNVIDGVENPERFARRTGSTQQVEKLEGSKFTWLEPYCATTACDDDFERVRDDNRPLSNYRVGGNVTRIFTPPRHTDVSLDHPLPDFRYTQGRDHETDG